LGVKEIDYIYKNFDPVIFAKKLEKANINTKDERGLDFLAGIVLDSVQDINQLKNKINLYQFTNISEDRVFNNFVKKFKNNYSDKDIKKYFFEQMNILNTRINDIDDIDSLLEQHVNCGEFFRNFNKYFQIIFYAQVTYTNHTYDDDEQYGQFRDYYCLYIKSIKKYYLFSFNYHDRVMEMEYTGISKIFKYRPNKSELIKILELGDERIHPDKKEIRVKQYQTFNYDKSYNRIYSEGYKLKHKNEPHFLKEEDYFNYHNTKGESYIAQKMAILNPNKYFKKYFKSWKQVSVVLGGATTNSHGTTRPKIKEKIKDNAFFKFVMSNKFNYRNNIKFIEDIIYSYDDIEGFLEYIPKKIQEGKSLMEEIRILRLFRGKNKNFIIKVFNTNKDKLADLAKSYMPSTIFDDPILMNRLIKLDLHFTADIGHKLKRNKKFMSKVEKLLDTK
jgi:hypothetical protein|tara:strand:- start:46 stop:1383 length:1338 start_codon:yes stop_codon:yes gene_type:complete